MAQDFLEGLAKLSVYELPTDSMCMICLNAYSTQSLDNNDDPVRIPCNYHVGFECISIWLSPDKTAQNTCPYCRARFFPAQPRPYMEHDLMNNELDQLDDATAARLNDEFDQLVDRARAARSNNELDGATAPGRVTLEMTRRIGQIGSPGDDPAEDERSGDLDDFYGHFFQRTAQQYQESLQRARAILTPIWQLSLQSPADASSTQHHTEARETDIADLANSFRTLPFREAILYVRLGNYGARGLPPLPETVLDLTREQEEALFLELESRGAFTSDDDRPDYVGLSNRDKWQLHRERDGEVWNFPVEAWAGFGVDE